jgi:hypothetical protein
VNAGVKNRLKFKEILKAVDFAVVAWIYIYIYIQYIQYNTGTDNTNTDKYNNANVATYRQMFTTNISLFCQYMGICPVIMGNHHKPVGEYRVTCFTGNMVYVLNRIPDTDSVSQPSKTTTPVNQVHRIR